MIFWQPICMASKIGGFFVPHQRTAKNKVWALKTVLEVVCLTSKYESIVAQKIVNKIHISCKCK
jgi:hypothetical protein